MDDFYALTGFERVYGFMHPISANPLPDHADIEDLFKKLPFLVSNGGIREAVAKLKPIAIPKDVLSRRRLFVMLTFIVHVFIRDSPNTQNMVSLLPNGLAKPLMDLSRELGVMPICSYASTTQFNVSPFTKSTPDDDIVIMGSATGLKDELWFYQSSIFIERLAPEFIENVLLIHDGLAKKDHTLILNGLQGVLEVISQLKPKLMRIREHCGVIPFYKIIRRFLSGWKNDANLPNGVEYEGYGWQRLLGATAAQSPFVQLIDIVLGIEHDSAFARLIYDSVPAEDRIVLEYFKQRPTLRQIVLATTDYHAKVIFNDIIDSLYAFRDEHLKVVAEYILKPANLTNSVTTGTGGTDPHSFLTGYKLNTMAAKIM